MRRRSLLGGLGALFAGAAVGIGTGAFDTVDADRGVTLHVEEDSDAYVGLSALDESEYPNARFTEEAGGTLKIADVNTLSDRGEGEGVGLGSEYVILEMFELSNQGTQDAEFYFDPDPDELPDGDDPDGPVTDQPAIAVFEFIDEDGNSVDDSNPLELDSGESEKIGVRVETERENELDTGDLPPSFGEGDTVISADETET